MLFEVIAISCLPIHTSIFDDSAVSDMQHVSMLLTARYRNSKLSSFLQPWPVAPSSRDTVHTTQPSERIQSTINQVQSPVPCLCTYLCVLCCCCLRSLKSSRLLYWLEGTERGFAGPNPQHRIVPRMNTMPSELSPHSTWNIKLVLFIITRLMMIIYNVDDEDDGDRDDGEHTGPAPLFAESTPLQRTV